MKLISERLPSWIVKYHTFSSNHYLFEAPLESKVKEVHERLTMKAFCAIAMLLTLVASVQSRSIKFDQGECNHGMLD